MSGWFAVECVFLIEAGSVVPERGQVYEERITLWHAANSDEALARAGVEAETFAKENGYEWIDHLTAYELFDPPTDGSEVWSFMRDSWLTPKDYINRFIIKGDPHEQPFEG